MPLPSQIKFTSDDNVLELLEDTIDDSGGNESADYKYIKSKTKKGQTVELSLSRINKLLGTLITIPKTAIWVSKKLGTSNPVRKTETKGKTTTELAEMMKALPQKRKTGSVRDIKK